MESASRRVPVYPGKAVRGCVEAMPTNRMECAKFAREVPRVYSACRLLPLESVGKFPEERWLLTYALA